jgi:hypothetical protein
MIFLSRVDVGFGVGLAAAGVPGVRFAGVFLGCVCGLVVVPVWCGVASVSGCGSGVGAAAKTSELPVFEFELDNVLLLPVSVFDCEAMSTVGSTLGSSLGMAEGEVSGSGVTAR